PATLSLDLVSLVCSLCCFFLFLPGLPPLRPTLFPYTTLFRSQFPARVPARRDQQWRFRPRARPCSSGGSPRLLPLARGTGRAAAFLPVPTGSSAGTRAGGLPRPGPVARGGAEVLGFRGRLQPQRVHFRCDGRGFLPARFFPLRAVRCGPIPLHRRAGGLLRLGGRTRAAGLRGCSVRRGEACDGSLLLVLLAFHLD